MALSTNSIEMLVDLVEIKMLCMEVRDDNDRVAMEALAKCRHELIVMARSTAGVKLVPMSQPDDLPAVA